MHQQHSTPLLVDIDGYRNVTELLKRRAEDAPQHVAFEIPTKSGDLSAPWQPISTQEFHFEVSQLAKGFIAAGVKVGDAVAIMSETRYEWAVVDLAAWFAGAVVVSVFDTDRHSKVVALIRRAVVDGSSSRGKGFRRRHCSEPSPLFPRPRCTCSSTGTSMAWRLRGAMPEASGAE